MGFVTFFLSTRIGNALGLLMIGALALTLWTMRAEHKGAQKVLTKVAVATQTESDRRLEALAQAQEAMKKPLADMLAAEQRNGFRLQEIEHASHAHDTQPCLGADAVQRLRAIQ